MEFTHLSLTKIRQKTEIQLLAVSSSSVYNRVSSILHPTSGVGSHARSIVTRIVGFMYVV